MYTKTDDRAAEAATLVFQSATFIPRERTADFQTTSGLLELMAGGANQEDIESFLEERNLSLEDIGEPPVLGYLGMTSAPQWRLRYRRVVDLAAKGEGDGLEDLLEA